MRILGLNKTQAIEKFPDLADYKKEKNFVTIAYNLVIDKITEGLNLQDCKTLAKEKLNFSLVTALNIVDDFKKGTARVNYRLDEAIGVIDEALVELKKFFYTPKTYHRVSRTLMIVRRPKEASKVIWLMTGFYIDPQSWTHLINEVIDDKVTYIKFYYTEKGIRRVVRINLHEYKIQKERLLRVKFISENKEQKIIDLVNSHFGCFKISSVFAIEEIGDRLIIYPTCNKKEKVEMNLFEFEDLLKEKEA